MIKKTLSVILMLLIIFQSCLCAFCYDVSGRNDEDVFVLLRSLDIMRGDENGNFNPDKQINRAEYTAMILRLLNMEELAHQYGVVHTFSDVDESHWAYHYLSLAKDMKLVDGISETEFGVYSDVKYQDAVKILVCALGYRVVAERKGGYPDGYLSVALDLKLLKGLGNTKTFTRAQAAKMIENALTVDIMDNLGYVIYGNDVLSTYFDMSVKEGVVTAVPELKGKNDISDNQIEISGVTYRTIGMNTDSLLGLSVKCYVKQASDEVIYHIVPVGNDESEIVDARSILDTTDLTKLVYQNENEKAQTLKLSDELEIYHNGVLLNSMYHSKEALMPKSGSVLLRDADKDGVYELAIVNSYRYVIVTTVSEYSIYDKFGNNIYFEDVENFKITDGRENLSLSDINKGDIICVAESMDGNSTAIYTTKNESLSGRITGIDTQDDETEYTVALADGTERILKLAENYFQAVNTNHHLAIKAELGLGIMNFCLNDEGDICDITKDTEGEKEFTYGYLIDFAAKGNLSQTLQYEILTPDNKLTVLESNKNITLGRYNGGRYTSSKVSGSDIIDVLVTDGEVNRQIVSFKRKDGYLSELNLASPTVDNDNLSLDAQKEFRVYNNGVLGQQYYVDANTAVFSIHGDGEYEDIVVAGYGKSYFSNEIGYECSLFDIKGSKVSAVIVHDRFTKRYDSTKKGYESNISYSSSPVLYINSVSHVREADGSYYAAVTGYQGGKEVTISLSESLSENPERMAELKKGVAVQYDMNSVVRNRALTSDEPEQMIDFLVVFDFNSPPTSKALWEYGDTEIVNAALFVTWGNVSEATDRYCSVKFYSQEVGEDKEYSCSLKDDTVVLEYDSDNKKFELKNIYEIRQGCNALIRQCYSKTKEVVIY